jgi:hypothetical protein
MVEPGMHVFEALQQESLARWRGIEKLCKSSLNQDALADARPVGCDVKPAADSFAQPNRHFAARRIFALARGANVNAIGLRIRFGELLHFVIFPNPMIATAASRHD